MRNAEFGWSLPVIPQSKLRIPPSSEHLQRIDIDDPLDVFRRLKGCGDFADGAVQRGAVDRPVIEVRGFLQNKRSIKSTRHSASEHGTPPQYCN